MLCSTIPILRTSGILRTISRPTWSRSSRDFWIKDLKPGCRFQGHITRGIGDQRKKANRFVLDAGKSTQIKQGRSYTGQKKESGKSHDAVSKVRSSIDKAVLKRVMGPYVSHRGV